MRVGMTEELLHWICGYGKNAMVVSPEALATRVLERRG
ncbi:MAG: WYL domain-containing protein [Myxococcota bacterium]